MAKKTNKKNANKLSLEGLAEGLVSSEHLANKGIMAETDYEKATKGGPKVNETNPIPELSPDQTKLIEAIEFEHKKESDLDLLDSIELKDPTKERQLWNYVEEINKRVTILEWELRGAEYKGKYKVLKVEGTKPREFYYIGTNVKDLELVEAYSIKEAYEVFTNSDKDEQA